MRTKEELTRDFNKRPAEERVLWLALVNFFMITGSAVLLYAIADLKSFSDAAIACLVGFFAIRFAQQQVEYDDLRGVVVKAGDQANEILRNMDKIIEILETQTHPE